MSTADPLTCAAVRAQIERYVDGELDAVECGSVERHCADCPTCAELVNGLRQTIGLCRDVGHAPLPRAISDRAKEQVKRLLADPRMQ